MKLTAAFAVLALSAAPALADEGTDFIARVSGSWSGSGTIRTGASEPPGATTCRLTGRASGASLQISGACDGAGRGANLSVSLTWVPATRQFTGSFSGGAESGTASLVGRVSGNTVTLAVQSSGCGRSNMTFSLSGATARLTVSGKDSTGKTVQFVALPLRKS